jgi:hypothetical protein
MAERIGMSGRRGFWLRCFLGAIVLVGLTAGQVHAQIDVPGPIHLVHLRGVVVNPKGQPVSNADVSLLRDDRVAYATHTDGAGQFAFERVDGHYVFRVKTAEYSVATRNVVVEFEISKLAHKQVYVVLGPGACSDDCSSVFTSKSDFDRMIRRNTGHFH